MPRDLRDMSVEDMWVFLGKTEENMSKAFPKLPSIQRAVKVSDLYTQYTIYLNSLSDIIHKELDKRSGKCSKEVIRFFDRYKDPPSDHVTGKNDRPDFFAMKLRVGESAPLEFPWSALVATGELLSGNNKEALCTKTAAYTSYLLQARPDMVTVQGIYIDPDGFRLVASNACGALNTNNLKWELHLLLCAWIWCLYEPHVDPSITANIERGIPVTFDITLPHVAYLNCTIHSAGHAFVIKEQYNEISRRFEEGPTLDKIHKNGAFPGVVRPGWYGPVGSSKEEELVVDWGRSERKKTRVVLLDKAPSIMDAKTPREALVAMYDLLEITRFLHKKRGILHRDISNNNVRLRDVVPPYTSSADNNVLALVVSASMSSVDTDIPPAAVSAKQSIAEELQEMCFASYLLHTKFNSSTRPGRLDTGVLLIDFDMSEDQEPDNQGDNKKPPQARTGTPIFVARAVVSNMYKEGRYTLEPMPKLDQGNETYKVAVPDRLKAFPPNKLEHYEILSDIPYESFKHKLQHDAESVFWLLLWWAILACPVGNTSPNDKEINQMVWDTLTDKHDAEQDPREHFINPISFPRRVVHPVYKSLETLLRDMARQLCGDHEKGEDESRKQDDYLHEAFQRLILEFLFAHYNEGFMIAQKGLDFRQPKNELAMEGSLSAHRISMMTRASAASFSHNAQSASSYNTRSASSRSIQSDPSRKRKRSDEDASYSDSNDGDYKPKPRK